MATNANNNSINNNNNSSNSDYYYVGSSEIVLDLPLSLTDLDGGDPNTRNNISTFDRYYMFHCRRPHTKLDDDDGGDMELVHLLFGKELSETDLRFSTHDGVKNSILNFLFERFSLDRLLLRRPYGMCPRWNLYVREGGLHGSSPATNIIGRPPTVPPQAPRGTMGDKADAVICRTYPLYTAIRLGFTWSRVMQNLIQADPKVLESFDFYKVLPPFALAATLDEQHEQQCIHPPPPITDVVVPQIQPLSAGEVTISDANDGTTVLETDTTIQHNNNNTNTKDRTCVMCGGHLFHLDTSINNDDENSDNRSIFESNHTITIGLTDSLMDGTYFEVRYKKDVNSRGGANIISHRLPQRQNSGGKLGPERENVRWLDTIYHLLRADPTILDKIMVMGRAELDTLSLKERQKVQ